MSDLISRQAAVDALNEYFVRIGKLKRRGLTQGEKAISLDTVGAIKTLPSAQPTVEAIPVEFIKSEIKENKGFYNSNLRRLLDVWAERKE